MKPHRGTLVLVLGILSFVGCSLLTSIPAWIIGAIDLKEMDKGVMDPSGRDITKVGMILGIVNVVMAILAIIFFIAIFGLSVFAGVLSGAANQ